MIKYEFLDDVIVLFCFDYSKKDVNLEVIWGY